jgi:hypothetical protein
MERVGSRAQVMHGNAKMTGGGLKKKDLKYNKQGKIVSKKMSQRAKKEKRLQKAGYTARKGEFKLFQKHIGGAGKNDTGENDTGDAAAVATENDSKKKLFYFIIIPPNDLDRKDGLYKNCMIRIQHINKYHMPLSDSLRTNMIGAIPSFVPYYSNNKTAIYGGRGNPPPLMINTSIILEGYIKLSSARGSINQTVIAKRLIEINDEIIRKYNNIIDYSDTFNKYAFTVKPFTNKERFRGYPDISDIRYTKTYSCDIKFKKLEDDEQVKQYYFKVVKPKNPIIGPIIGKKNKYLWLVELGESSMGNADKDEVEDEAEMGESFMGNADEDEVEVTLRKYYGETLKQLTSSGRYIDERFTELKDELSKKLLSKKLPSISPSILDRNAPWVYKYSDTSTSNLSPIKATNIQTRLYNS